MCGIFIFFCFIFGILGFLSIFFLDIEERCFFVVDFRFGKIRLRRSNEGVVLLLIGCVGVLFELEVLFCICDGFIIVFCVIGWDFCSVFVRVGEFFSVEFLVDKVCRFFFLSERDLIILLFGKVVRGWINEEIWLILVR